MATIKDTIAELDARGLIQDISDREGLENLETGRSFYVGLDPTALSLQIGNLIPIIVSVHLARGGLKPITLFGGATGSIGDPSGRDEERKLLSWEVIEENVKRQTQQATAIFERAGIKSNFMNNMDWTRDVTFLEFLRDVGKYYTVNYMLQKEVIKSRVEGDGISFTEFSYMLLQGFDYHHLYKTHDTRLQIGGSDQWGNITSGLELIRKKGESGAYAFSWPLITDSAGKKFGKSVAGGAIWLNAEETSPYKLHQYFINQSDEDAVRYLKVFTFIPLDEIAEIEKAHMEAPQKREAQKRLADEVVTLVHGEEATAEAKKSAEVLFGGSLEGLSETQLEDIFSDVPSKSISRVDAEGMSYLDMLVEAKAVKSKGEGKRLITGGGAYLDNEKVSDLELQFKDTDSSKKNLVVLRTGKKNYTLVKLV